MIQCNNCGFAVNEMMKYALMNNMCPSCGSGLFSGRDSNLINMIQTKVLGERFASKLTSELVYDISLFIFNELKHGIGKALREEISTAEDDEIKYEEGADEVEDLPEDILLRKEIEKEYAGHLNALEDDNNESIQSDDLNSKAKRLRMLHQQRMMNNPNLGKEIPLVQPGAKSGPRVNRRD